MKFARVDTYPILFNTFGRLAFRSNTWTPHPSSSFSFFMETLYEGEQDIDEVIAEFSAGPFKRIAIGRHDDSLVFFFDPIKSIHQHLHQKCVSQTRPFYLKFPFIYDLTSAKTHFYLYRLLSSLSLFAHRKVSHPYPEWPTDYSLLTLLSLLNRCGVRSSDLGIFTGPWPNKKKSIACLSHDVDDINGYNEMHRLIEIENDVGFKATYNIPGTRYPVDLLYLKDLESFGFEIGIHGYRHKGETPFLSQQIIEERILESIKRFSGLNIRGYRSPVMRRTERLLTVLAKYFEYDSSVPDTENFARSDNFNGCSIPHAFLVGNLVEIPITVPQDGILLMLGYTPDNILNVWQKKIAILKQLGAIIVINTHPDPIFSGNEVMCNVYRRLLCQLKADGEIDVMTLGEICRWIKSSLKEKHMGHFYEKVI